jgi:hypothetical protein
MANNLAHTLLRRNGSIFSSSRVSTSFTSRLTGQNGKIDERRTSDLTDLAIATSPDPEPSKESSRAASLKDAFDAADPVDPPTNPCLLLENKCPALRPLRTDEDIGDGLWICCHCRHENKLRHRTGPFPFFYPRCDKCGCQECSGCHSSEILTLWSMGMISAQRPAPRQAVRYRHVCTNYDLTHLGSMEGTTLEYYRVTCAGCGKSSY